MGSQLYDFLSDSLLFRDSFLDSPDTVPLSEVQKELQRYREFVLQNEHDVYVDAAGDDSNLSLYSSENISPTDLLHAALYMKRYVLRDPLFRLTMKRSEAGKTLTKAGFVKPSNDDGKLDIRSLQRALRFMKTLTPMIAGNFVKFVPSSKSTEDTEELPIYASNNFFEDALPSQVLRKFQEAAEVSAVVSLGEGHFRFARLKPTRGISIQFRGDTDGHAFMYSLHRIEQSKLKDGTDGEFEMRLSLPDTPPDEAEFKAWVRQSVNQAARNRFRDTFEDAELAAQLNAAMSTHSQLRFDVLRIAVEPSTSQPLHTANTFLNMELPVLDDIDVDNLMKVRQEDGEAFANFRFALDHKLSRLRGITDAKLAKRAGQEAIEELTEVQLREVQQKVRNIYQSAGRRAVAGGLVSLVAAVQNRGLGLLTAAAAAGHAYYDSQADIKLNPAFFLWKALRKQAKKRR